MNRPASFLFAMTTLILLSACTTTQPTPRYVEVPAPCCCAEHRECDHEHGRCHAMNPDDLDDFGPRPGHPRIVRCDEWQSMDRYAERCPD